MCLQCESFCIPQQDEPESTRKTTGANRCKIIRMEWRKNQLHGELTKNFLSQSTYKLESLISIRIDLKNFCYLYSIIWNVLRAKVYFGSIHVRLDLKLNF